MRDQIDEDGCVRPKYLLSYISLLPQIVRGRTHSSRGTDGGLSNESEITSHHESASPVSWNARGGILEEVPKYTGGEVED